MESDTANKLMIFNDKRGNLRNIERVRIIGLLSLISDALADWLTIVYPIAS